MKSEYEGVLVMGNSTASSRADNYANTLGNRTALELRIYAENMLQQIDAALNNVGEYERAFYILYFGLSTEHGRYSSKTIADLYDMTESEVREYIARAEACLPSVEHVQFARKFWIDYQ